MRLRDGKCNEGAGQIFGIKTGYPFYQRKAAVRRFTKSLLPAARSAEFNQAIADFGATVCKTGAAALYDCPFSGQCTAYGEGTPGNIQSKQKRRYAKAVHVLYHPGIQGKIAVEVARTKDIWRNLTEFVLIELEPGNPYPAPLFGPTLPNLVGADADIVYTSPVITQALTHQQIEGLFIHVKSKSVIVAGRAIVDRRVHG